jgi:hypothetical protein
MAYAMLPTRILRRKIVKFLQACSAVMAELEKPS